MKKVICALMALLMIAYLAACGNSADSGQSLPTTEAPPESVSPVSSANEESEEMSQATEASSEDTNSAPSANGDTQTPVPDEKAGSYVGSNASDEPLDLTALSSTMVYAEVYNMMVTPENYIGRTVTMAGQFAVFAETETGPYYYACVIADATACCQQGIEFVLLDKSLTFPDDYPESGSEIIVTGEFQTYMDGEYMYCHLVDAVLEPA